MCGYTNEDNPFGDKELTKKFVWGKKRATTATTSSPASSGPGRAVAVAGAAQSNEEAKVMAEIEKVKRRRAEREAEKEAMEAERLRQMREKEAENYSNWEVQQEAFYQETVMQRSTIRIREGRTRPIDVLALLLDLHRHDRLRVRASVLEANASKVELATTNDATVTELDAAKAVLESKLATLPICVYKILDPVAYLSSLDRNRLQSLVEDARTNMENDAKQSLWPKILQLATRLIDALDSHLHKQLVRHAQTVLGDPASSSSPASSSTTLTNLTVRDTGAVHAAVSSEVSAMLEGKSRAELETLESEVRNALEDPEMREAIDVEFFESILEGLGVSKLEAEFTELYHDAQRVQAAHLGELAGEAVPAARPGGGVEEDTLVRLRNKVMAAHVGLTELAPDMPVNVDLIAHDNHILSPMSQHAFRIRKRAGERDALEEILDADAAGGMENMEDLREEMIQDAELVLGDKAKMWDDRLKPRKPVFFCRKITGFSWNAYTRAHYDSVNNPPPRLVRGLRLDVLLPDLIDPTSTPSLEVIPNGDETATLIISPGPPYFDIAFKILDKPWDRRSKGGYRCTFDRGVFKLHFRYKRQFYRR